MYIYVYIYELYMYEMNVCMYVTSVQTQHGNVITSLTITSQQCPF